ncbi:MAG: hypothetical protein ACMVP2_03735 [Imperialibacter sp.]|uniref:hypothetical protein n=1 Tax=Imperialibacter sp. TaxID=2038411 RepID=UPI003A8A2D49
MWTGLIIGTTVVLAIEFVLIRSFFMAVKRIIPRIYVLLPFVLYTVDVVLLLVERELEYKNKIALMNAGKFQLPDFGERISNFGIALNDKVLHEVNLLTLYLCFILTALISAGLYYRNEEIRTDLLNSVGLSMILGPTLYLLRLLWIK